MKRKENLLGCNFYTIFVKLGRRNKKLEKGMKLNRFVFKIFDF